jgi:hypothetical protein
VGSAIRALARPGSMSVGVLTSVAAYRVSCRVRARKKPYRTADSPRLLGSPARPGAGDSAVTAASTGAAPSPRRSSPQPTDVQQGVNYAGHTSPAPLLASGRRPFPRTLGGQGRDEGFLGDLDASQPTQHSLLATTYERTTTPPPNPQKTCRYLRADDDPSPEPSEDRAAMKASWGTSTRPTIFIRFLPSFCFSRSLRLRVMSPP